jgi:hypothetical protein
MKNFIVIIILFFITISSVDASIFNSKEITLSFDQKEYYFRTGERAIIEIVSKNTYNEDIEGNLTYTIKESADQLNFLYSNSVHKSTPLSIEIGNGKKFLDFGTSNYQSTQEVDLIFEYMNNNRLWEITIRGLKIYFVSDDSTRENNINKLSGSTQKKVDDESSIKKEQIPSTNQRIQKNQKIQDSNSIRTQFQRQINEQNRMKENFRKELMENKRFQHENQKLQDDEYEISLLLLDPSSDNTGFFRIDYNNPSKQNASIKGVMENGEITALNKDTIEKRKDLLKQIQQDSRYKNFERDINNKKLKNQTPEFYFDTNLTKIEIVYKNEDNESAIIKAIILEDKIEELKILKSYENRLRWGILVIFALPVILALIYKKFSKRNPKSYQIKETIEEDIDYLEESKRLIKEAEKLFAKKDYKEAYGTAARALRLFFCYKKDIKKETTNEEIIYHLRKNNEEIKIIKECLDLCSLVEFAKYKTNEKDFYKIINISKDMIGDA